MSGTSHAKEHPDCVALYYGKNPPPELFYAFDWLILDPDGVSNGLPKNRKAVVFGYVSLGELQPFKAHFKEINRDWIIGKNEFWGSHIMDMRNKDYREFLMNSVIQDVLKKGFDGLFFDTLDSYHLAIKDEEEKRKYENYLAEFIRNVKVKHPNIRIITNRGFEIIDRIAPYINAVLTEGLFQKLDTAEPGQTKYIPVKEDDRRWLIERLNRIKQKGIPVIVVDYINPNDRKGAREIVSNINSLGFIPYVSNKELNIIGYSNCELLPRRVLLLYDGKQEEADISNVHRLIAMPLEHLGFVPEMWDFSKGLPQGFLGDRYAGAILWTYGNLKDHEEFYSWVRDKIEEGVRMIFINSFGFPMEEQYLKPLGVEVKKSKAKKSGEKNLIIYKDNIVGFEIEPRVSPLERILIPAQADSLVVFKNAQGQESAPLAITEWGAYALFNTFAKTLLGNTLYVTDPFEFFKRALRPEFPAVPDITTENGRRIFFTHIDGDGFMERTEWDRTRFAAEAIRDYILKGFQIPHTLSVIEGEIAPWGLFPEISGRLEEIAKSMFRLENVEIASHSFSHPFFWKMPYKKRPGVLYNLPIKGYDTFDLRREIIGSVDYINTRLAPENKKTRVFLWTGDCRPSAEALRITQEIGLLNLNGGLTVITNLRPFLSHISPMGINNEGFFHVYAPVQSEFHHTNEWKGPFFGFVNVIQTFQLTEKPRRLKPVNIYYHLYSGSKKASLRALKEVFRWALSQRTNAMFASDFIRKVHDFRNMTIVRRGDKWAIRGSGDLRTLRMVNGPTYGKLPDMRRSKGIVGHIRDTAGVYIHLDGSGNYSLSLTDKEMGDIVLNDANGRVVSFKRDNNSLLLELQSYTPLEFSLSNTDGWELEIKTDSLYSREVKPGEVSFRLKRGLSAYVSATRKDKF